MNPIQITAIGAAVLTLAACTAPAVTVTPSISPQQIAAAQAAVAAVCSTEQAYADPKAADAAAKRCAAEQALLAALQVAAGVAPVAPAASAASATH